ncbi:Transposase IS200 like protein [Rubripirellula obstinata]|uniref:Transposase IS200 like protein n=1 Tax=Rubripirellula obstinata TaxID=406547 RepID=A0A5B1CF11_9BACT|nr:IS200/IS605 family transposase [Rubripirellula obstinata]KAA1257924.1 Transposase IS200 like protein [Rubripirellula obstinata]
MASTHHMLLYHFVFSTKNRKPYLQPQTRDRVFEYLGGTVRGLDGVPIRIGGWVDHVHLLVKLKTQHCIADFMREVKSNSSKHFNESSGMIAKFGWQDGYGVFTVSGNAKAKVIAYIENQVDHHADESYSEEYVRMLNAAGVEYDERYLWD